MGISTAEVAVASATAAPGSPVVYVVGSQVAVAYARRRRRELEAYLADPDRG